MKIKAVDLVVVTLIILGLFSVKAYWFLLIAVAYWGLRLSKKDDTVIINSNRETGGETPPDDDEEGGAI